MGAAIPLRIEAVWPGGSITVATCYFCFFLLMTLGSITLLCTGPLTNIAVALMLDPSFGCKLKNCVIMGGNYAGVFES